VCHESSGPIQGGFCSLLEQLHPYIHNLLDRYVTLWEQADIPGLVALLREDA
jgi:hypothetical protein